MGPTSYKISHNFLSATNSTTLIMPEPYAPAPESEEALYGSYIVRDIWVFYGIGITSALLRIIIRCGVTRRLGLEEALMLLLSIFFTGYILAVRHYLIHGTNLMTPSERLVVMLNPDLIRAHESGSKALVMAWCLYISIIWGCKTTIWLVCRRLTDRAAAQKRRVLFAGWLVVVTYIIAMMTVLTICSPFDGYWQIYPVPGSKIPHLCALPRRCWTNRSQVNARMVIVRSL